MSRLSLPSPAALPPELRKELTLLDLRLRWISFVKGCGSLLFVTLLMTIAFLGLDFVFPLPGTVRILFLLTLLATIGGLFYRWLLTPLTRPRRWPELAYLIDRSFPDLQERVSSTVELSMWQQKQMGSEFMWRRLQQETDKKLSGIDLWECLSLGSMATALFGGILTALVVSIPFLFHTGGYSLLWQRLLTPWENLDSATNLTFVVENGDRTVPRGDDLLIRARPEWRYAEGTLPREITLLWSDQHGQSESRALSYDAQQGAYVGKIPQVRASLSYSLASSGARSRTYQIHVADRPRILDVRLTIEPPAYTHREPTVQEGAMGTIRAIEGSQLIAEITFAHPVESAEWVWRTPRPANNSPDPANSQTAEGKVSASPASSGSHSSNPRSSLSATRLPAVLSPDGTTARIITTADRSDDFRFEVLSPEQLRNIDEPERRLQVIADRAPRLELSGSDEPLKVRPDELILVDLMADDDFGVVDLQVLVEQLSGNKENPAAAEWTSSETGPDVRLVNDRYELDLRPLNLKNGDILGYRAVARDGRPDPGPNEVWTSRRVLLINTETPTLAGQEVEEFYEGLRRQAELVKSEVTTHRKDVEQRRRELDPKPREEAEKTLTEKKEAWLQQKLALSLQLDDLSRKLQQRPITSALSKMNAEPAQQLLNQAAEKLEAWDKERSQSQQESLELIRQDERSLRETESLMSRLMNQLQDAERIEQELTQLQQLSRRAKQLAQQASQLNPAAQQKSQKNSPQTSEQTSQQTAANSASALDPSALEQLQSDYSALSGDLQKLLKERPELQQAAKNALLSELAKLAEQAEKMAQRQTAVTASSTEHQQLLQTQQQANTDSLQQIQNMAEQLAAMSEREAQQQNAPVFDPADFREAAAQQQQANLGKSTAALERARQQLQKFSQSRQTAEPLPEERQQAVLKLAEQSQKLSEQAEKQPNELPSEWNSQLAALRQAVGGLSLPPAQQQPQADILRKLDQAGEELLKQSDRVDDRLRDAAKSLNELARHLGSDEARTEKLKAALKQHQDQTQQRLTEIQKLSTATEPAADAMAKLTQQQRDQIQALLRQDVLDQEAELAKVVQTALAAKELTEQQEWKQAEQAHQTLLDQLTAWQQKLDSGKETSSEKLTEVEKKASATWQEVPLTPEMRQQRFPLDPLKGRADLEQQLKEVAQAQQQLQNKTAEILQKHAAPEQASQLKSQLQKLQGEQRKLAEKTAQLPGDAAQLPRHQAARAQQQAADSLKQGEPQAVKEHQRQAAQQLAQAQAQLQQRLAMEESVNAAPQAAEQPSVEELTAALQQKLQELESQPQESTPATDSGRPAENPVKNNAEAERKEEHLSAQAALQESQQRISEQTQQLAEQLMVQHPDQAEKHPALQQAAEHAAQLQELLDSGQMQAALKQAEQIQQQLQQASETKELEEATQSATAQLAEQQSELVQQLQAFAQQPEVGKQIREQAQQQLIEQTEQLSQTLQKVGQHSLARPIQDRHVNDQIQQLRQQFAAAGEEMKQGLEQSQQNNLQESVQHSAAARQELQSLGQRLAKLAAGKRDTLVPEPVGQEAAEASRQLSQAEESLKQAMEHAQQQAQQAAQQMSQPQNAPQQAQDSAQQQTPASESMSQSSENASSPSSDSSPETPQVNDPLNQLAEQLAQAAQALDQAHQNLQPKQDSSSSADSQESQGQPQGNPQDESDGLGGNQTSLPADLQSPGSPRRSALMRQWGQRQGELEAELNDARRRTVDQEYAPLIQRYFESLATPKSKKP